MIESGGEMSFACLLDASVGTFGSQPLLPAHLAFQKLQQHPQAKKKLSKMRVEVSEFSGALNIFETTLEDMKFFSKLLNNDECSYVDVLRLSSFYY